MNFPPEMIAGLAAINFRLPTRYHIREALESLAALGVVLLVL